MKIGFHVLVCLERFQLALTDILWLSLATLPSRDIFDGERKFLRGGRKWYINIIKTLASRIFNMSLSFVFREISINAQVKKKICYHGCELRWIDG